MNISPDLDQKKGIIENSVELAHALGIDIPKIAVVAAKEKVSPKMEATVHAKELADMNSNNQIKDCIVEGPFALDNAISKEAAEHKGIKSVAAQGHRYTVNVDIEAGNVLYSL